METKILMSDLIGTELRSRTEARKIIAPIRSVKVGKVLIGFSGVTFISRSFADEFCGIIENERLLRTIDLLDKCDNVDITLSIVMKNRNMPKSVQKKSETKEFSDMESLSDFLATI